MVNIIKCYSVNVNKNDLLKILKYQRIKKNCLSDLQVNPK